jgi:hypothetical protein
MEELKAAQTKVADQQKAARLRAKADDLRAGKSPAQSPKVTPVRSPELQKALDQQRTLRKMLMAQAKSLRPMTPLQKILAARAAGLVGAIRTVGKVGLSHIAAIPAEEVAKVPAAFADALRVARVGGERTQLMPKVSDIMQAAARGAKQGSRESFVILRKGSETAALKEGLIQDLHVDNSSLIDRARTGNRVVDSYIRANLAPHAIAYRPMRIYAFVRSLQEQARLTARAQGLRGVKYEEMVKQLVNTPTEDMTANAALYSEEQVFMNQTAASRVVGAAIQHAEHADSSHIMARAAEFMLPIRRVPFAVAGRTLEYTPLDLVNWSRGAKLLFGKDLPAAEYVKWKNGFGRASTGTAISGFGYYLAKNGLLTGYGPRTDGKPRGSILIHGRWYAASMIPPIGAILCLGATTYDVTNVGDDPKRKKREAQMGAMLQGLTEEIPFSRMADLWEAASHPGWGSKIENLIGEQIGSFIPTQLSDIAAQMDASTTGRQRKVEGVGAVVQNRIPGMRQKLPQSNKRETNKLYDPLASKKALNQ